MQSDVCQRFFGLLARRNKVQPKARSRAGAATARCSSNCGSRGGCPFSKSRPSHRVRSIWLPAPSSFRAPGCRKKLPTLSERNPPDWKQRNQQNGVVLQVILSLRLSRIASGVCPRLLCPEPLEQHRRNVALGEIRDDRYDHLTGALGAPANLEGRRQRGAA
jgi:hypothetical protein